MKDGITGRSALIKLVVDDALTVAAPMTGVEVQGLSSFRDSLIRLEDNGGGQALALADSSVLGLCLSSDAARSVAEDAALSDLLEAAGVEVVDLGDAPTAAAILAAGLQILAQKHQRLQSMAGGDQRALAGLRRQHMQIQDDYAELEAWVWDHLAPKRFVVRDWPVSADVFALAPGMEGVIQPLPAPVRGVIGLDLYLAESSPAGTLHMQAVRPVGPAFEGMQASLRIAEGPARRVHVQFPRAGGGAPEDVSVALRFEAEDGTSALPLSLAPPSPFEDFCLRTAEGPLPQPLALRLHKTLPRMPAPALHDNRSGLPADGITRMARPNDLAKAEMLQYFRTAAKQLLRRYPDDPTVEHNWEKNAVMIRPSVHLPVVARIRGVQVEGLTQVRAIVQNARHDAMEIAFAVGVAPAGAVNWGRVGLDNVGQWVHLLPAEWGEVWYDLETPLSGWVDLILVTAMPNMPFNRNAEAMFHGFRLTAAKQGESDGAPA